MWLAPEAFHSPLFIAIATWLWGSFLNQVVDRTPLRHPPSGAWTPGWLHPRRSVCLACRAPLPWYENIPVFSYLWLRGRCRHCGVAIGVRTLVLEVATPIILLGWFLILPPEGGRAALFWAGAALASWLVVAVTLLLERRRWPPVIQGAGLLAAAACVAAFPW